MLINREHEAVKKLCDQWAKYKGTNPYLKDLRSTDHQRSLRKILDEVVVPFSGELMLVYKRFLTMKPSGTHSFAHGTEMVSATVYWLTVCRIARAEPIYEKAGTRVMGSGKDRIRIHFASKHLLPVTAKVSLMPRYRSGKHEPYFVLDSGVEPKPALNNRADLDIDLAVLGQHLFNVNPGNNDWYTKAEIAFGNDSVEAWLTEHDSTEVLSALRAL
jgi:hypothetical protein